MHKIITAALLASALPGAASAQSAVPEFHVSHADLDLHNPAGIQLFNRRITIAIRAACRDAYNSGPFGAAAYTRCRKAKLAEVAPQRDAVLARAQHSDLAIASAR